MNCEHVRKGVNFVEIDLDLDLDLTRYIHKISKASGYTTEVVLAVLIAVGMDREERLTGVKKSFRICSEHPKYKGLRKPTTKKKCACHEYWKKKNA